MSPDLISYYDANDFCLMESIKPPIGENVEAVRIFATYGFGAVRLSTKRLIVPMTRVSELDFHDTLNDYHGSCSEFEAWRPCPPDDCLSCETPSV